MFPDSDHWPHATFFSPAIQMQSAPVKVAAYECTLAVLFGLKFTDFISNQRRRFKVEIVRRVMHLSTLLA